MISDVHQAQQEIQALHEQILDVQERFEREPEAWCVVSNPVWGRSEDMNPVALFDTKELATAYIEASLLPEQVMVPDGQRTITRSYRPDSVLWNYNHTNGTVVVVFPPLIGVPVSLPENPAPPSGPLPDTEAFPKLVHPKYGVDYGEGPAFQ
jgi:hypothetical protein